jgi:glyoxylase-like metal-dependent hydrolase (beta-lactamase superfamily II)
MAETATTLLIGDIRVRAVIDLDGYPFDLKFLLPDIKDGEVDPFRGWLEPTHLVGNEIRLAIRTLVMEVDGRNILIDACIGEHKDRPARPMFNKRSGTDYLAQLARLGLRPDDIDVVFCTHLHVDHVGWNTKLDNGRWVPTFPKARYLFGRKELDFWMGLPNRAEVGSGSLVDSVIPIVEAKACDLVDDGYDLGKGLKLAALPGHTPGQLGLDVVRGKERAFFVGDAVHSPVQVALPHLSTGFDTDKDQARATRMAFLDAAASDGSWLVPCHFRGPIAHKIKRAGTGFIIG